MVKKATYKDGQSVEKNIFARVATDGRITAFQVKITVAGSAKSITEKFDSLPEARSYRDSLRADLALDPYKERVLRARELAREKAKLNGVLVGDLLSDYKAEVVPKKKSAKSHGYMVERLKTYPIARLPVLAITRQSVVSLAEAIAATSVKDTTVNKHLSCLSACLKWARENSDFPIPNPVLELPTKLRRTTTEKPRDRRLLGDQEEAYLREALADSRNPELVPLFDLALETGARQGELLALKRADLHLQESIAIARDTKNGSDRPLLLSPRAVEVLSALKASKVLPVDGRVFRMNKSNLCNLWTRAKKRALQKYLRDCTAQGTKPNSKMLRDLRWHDLRRESISTVAESGLLVGVQELQTFSGHKDQRMLAIYVNRQDHGALAGKLAGMPRRKAF